MCTVGVSDKHAELLKLVLKDKTNAVTLWAKADRTMMTVTTLTSATFSASVRPFVRPSAIVTH